MHCQYLCHSPEHNTKITGHSHFVMFWASWCNLGPTSSNVEWRYFVSFALILSYSEFNNAIFSASYTRIKTQVSSTTILYKSKTCCVLMCHIIFAEYHSRYVKLSDPMVDVSCFFMLHVCKKFDKTSWYPNDQLKHVKARYTRLKKNHINAHTQPIHNNSHQCHPQQYIVNTGIMYWTSISR